jgi:Family of unknown function (DUF5681)
MPSPASLKNLKPWRPGQSGNPKGRPKAPKFTERERLEILVVLAEVFDEPRRRTAVQLLRAALTNPRTVLRAVELAARMNGELGSPSPRT